MKVIRLVIFVIFALVGSAAAQTKLSPAVQTYKNASIGLTYTFPATLAPQPENELPQSSGTEQIILALWDKPRHTPVPRVVFLYDSKVQPARFTPDEIALKYLQSLRPQAGYKMSKPQKVRIGANALWRMDSLHRSLLSVAGRRNRMCNFGSIAAHRDFQRDRGKLRAIPRKP